MDTFGGMALFLPRLAFGKRAGFNLSLNQGIFDESAFSVKNLSKVDKLASIKAEGFEK